MPRIDPLQLLNCLNVLLTPSGGIKSEQEVARISSLMEKFSKKLVSKCVYLLILKNSDPHLLSRFMSLGGWSLIYNWLVHAVEAKNYPFLIELLEIILVCPVSIERLKSNPMPRHIKALSRDHSVHTKVRDLASDIVKYWLEIVKNPPPVAPSESIPPTSHMTENDQRLKEERKSSSENHANEIHTSSEVSVGDEEEEDENYVKSTSPSSSSLDSDDSDVFVPYKKTQIKSKKKLASKKDKSLSKKPSMDENRKLKSKLISNSKGDKPGSIKMKIEVSSNNSSSESKSKKSDEKALEEKLKEKRKLKEEKEREKFARFKQVREKKEKHKDREKRDSESKPKEKTPEDKLKEELSKLIPRPLDKLGRIPKINKDKEKENSVSGDKRKDDKKIVKTDEKKSDKKEEKSLIMKENEKNKEKDIKKEKDGKKVGVATPPPKKPASISVEKRSVGEVKPKTVKAYNSKFRLTGLEQEVIPKPAARKSSSSSSTAFSGNSSTSSEKAAVKRSPIKDTEIEPIEKKLKSPDNSFSDEKSSPSSHRMKKPFLQESDSFMNAMDIALMSQKEQLRKRKKAAPKSESDGKGDETPGRKNSDASSPLIKPEHTEPKPAFKFYKDTLETSTEESMDTSESKKDSREHAETKSEITVDEIKKEKIINDPMKPRSAEGLKSSLAIFRARKQPKKSVTWKSDDDLEAVQYFEVDATERTNVVRNFWEMQMMERTKERDMMMVRKTGDNDKMTVQTKWKILIPIDVAATPATVRGEKSQEKNIQYARERTVPPSLYYNKSMIPDTPAEPDLEIHPVTVPPVIPLDDISGSQDSVNDFSAFKWPEPKPFAPDNLDMNAMKNFMAGMPPPIFPFPDGTFPPPFGQPFFPGGAVPPLPIPPANWNPNNADSNQQSSSNSIPWVPPGIVPPPGMMGPPPFGMMGPFPPIPGPGFPAPPNMFPLNNNATATDNSNGNSSNTENQQYSNNNYGACVNNDGGGRESGNANTGGSGGSKKWTNDDRYYNKKDGWRNNYNDRNRDKRGSGNWRGSGGNSRLCRIFQKKGFCNVSGCRFHHPDN